MAGQHRAAAEQLDGPAGDPEAQQSAERRGGRALGIGEQRVGQAQAAGPGEIAGHGVGVDARHRDAVTLVVLMGLAKLAKLAESAGAAVQDVEEEHQRPPADELS